MSETIAHISASGAGPVVLVIFGVVCAAILIAVAISVASAVSPRAREFFRGVKF